LGVAVTADGKSAYVTNVNSDTVSQYTIDPSTGTLSPKTPATVATGDGPVGVAATPDSTSAYVVDQGTAVPGSGRTVSQYTIDASTGALSPKTPATVGAGSGPAYVAVTPDARSAYVTNVASNNVSQYTIDAS